jgi:hypothetical protein
MGRRSGFRHLADQMANDAAACQSRGWFHAAIALVVVLTAWRVLSLALSPTDLFVDEAQYWLWGKEPALGYFSKPPLIGWIIGATTALAGSDAAFWVRLPAPLLHAATALILAAAVAPRWGAPAAFFVAATYATLPLVAVGSFLISTDTPMLSFAALACTAWVAVLSRRDRRARTALAFVAGAATSAAFLGKYAAVYFPMMALLAALVLSAARPYRREVVAALVGLVAFAAPNIWWNLVNGFPTVRHTVENTRWATTDLSVQASDLARAPLYVGEQALVYGPAVLAAALLVLADRRSDGVLRVLALCGFAVIAVVGVQAILAGANANWTAAAALPLSVCVGVWLADRGWGWRLSIFGFGGAVAILLPVLTVYPASGMAFRDRPLLDRYIGRADLSHALIEATREAGLQAIVAQDRAKLADLAYSGRDSGIAVFAAPPQGRPRHHYELTRPWTGEPTPVALVTRADSPPPGCALDPEPFAVVETDAFGAWRGAVFVLWRIEDGCWGRAEPPTSRPPRQVRRTAPMGRHGAADGGPAT